MSDRITTHDEAYAVTSSEKVGPCARSVFSIEANDKTLTDDIVRYGQEIRVQANPHILAKPLYLNSCPISPMAFARFSRNQEVCLHIKPTFNTVWRIIPAQGSRQAAKGQPVQVTKGVMLEHAGTQQMLSSDKIGYRNDFGNEWEVSCMSSATKSKTQMLAGEYNGEKVREEQNKAVTPTNLWSIELAQDPSEAEPIEDAPKYDGAQMIQDIKETLTRRGSMQIRGLGRIFRILDDNRNRQIDKNELMWGLKDFDIHLSEEQTDVLMKFFDRDGSGTIDFDEMLRALRGDLNESRLSYIKKAYDKLDVNKDGQVKLDDIAKLYDVSQHPDVIQGKMTPEEAYRQYMSMWDTQVADGIITFDEFCDYYRDVSASIDTDEYFAVMMTNAWKL